MHLLGFDPFVPAEKVKEMGIQPCASVQEMLPPVDYLTVHTTLTEETKNLIGAKEVQMLKKGARLINCAGAASMTRRPWPRGSRAGRSPAWPWMSIPKSPAPTARCSACRARCTPHLGASTHEAQDNVAVEAADLLIKFFAKGKCCSCCK